MSARADYERLFAATYAPPPPVFARGKGATLWDEAGRDYKDFGGGIAVVCLGHCYLPLARALAEQAAALMHTSNLHVNAAAVQLAQTLVANTFADRVFLCNSGAEANEAALKLARRRGERLRAGKSQVLAFDGGFHGRIGFAMAATAAEKIRAGFGGLAGGFVFAPYNNAQAAQRAASADLCAIIVEPVQGEGGVNVGEPDFLRALRALASQHDALLIYDEVQSGAGRTGALYSYMNGDVTPDVLTTAKGLGGGFPVAAMLASESAAAAFDFGAHGSTFGGNALAAAAANTVLTTLLSDGFLAGVDERAKVFDKNLRALQKQYGCFAEIRQRGLLIGCGMAAGWSAERLRDAALEEGLIVLTAANNTLRLAPALNIGEGEIKEGFARLQRAVAALAAAQK